MASVELDITPVMFGEVIPGTQILAPADLVAVRYDDGTGVGTAILIPAASAMGVAAQIATAAGQIVNRTVDDSGRKLSPAARLARLRARES